ncbi:TSC22 domain family protein 1 isoform X1 [Lepisosteus oculatus]|uniref:TSC22 domain family protein 1 isoform X1 n=1 Tax=Lepisosteus oculatus TaxID=7918 RepID=UPI0035F50C93
MHHPESAGDSASTRKMAHPAIFPRRGSSTGSGNISALAAAAGSSISNNVIPPDDYQSPLLIQPPPPAGSSSPVPQHPPQSLNLLSQSQLQAQPLQSAGAQMKKKSGFQITSVTPAQISVSTNNSIAEDTESYDDLDESHTEDLSSSEILDVSLSRATDLGGPERSSSEETLNNFHEAETPGAVSPNQPHLPSAPPHHQLLSQQQQQHGAMVNGTHHHHHPGTHHHGHQHHHPHAAAAAATPPGALPSALSTPGAGGPLPASAAVGPSVTAAAAATPLLGSAQKLPAGAGAALENASAVLPQPLPAGGPGGMLPAPAAAAVGMGPLGSIASGAGVGVGSSAGAPGLGGSGVAGTCGSGSGLPPGLMSLNASGQNVGVMQPPGGASVAMGAAPASSAMAAAAAAGGGPSGLAALVQAPAPQGQPQQTQVAPPAAASSRFRVVKLDSSSEPFRKGRWTCTEYYDKEAAAPAAPPSDGPPGHRLVESLRQTAPESAAGSERESTSGSSVSSTVSTLSHYTESVGSGEVGAPCVLQAFQQQPPQPADYSGPPGMQCSLPGLPQSGSQPQLAQAHVHAQDVVHSLLKTSGAPSIPVSIGAIQQQAPIGPMQASVGHPGAALPQQQLPYSQKTGQPAPAGVAPQQMGFPAPQPSAAPTQMPPAHAMPVSQGAGLPPDFVPHQPLLQTPVPPGPQQQQQQQQQPTMPPLPHVSGAMPPPAVTGNSQMMAAGQQQPGGGGSGGTVPAAVGQPPLQGILQQSTPSPPQMAQTAQGGILPQVLPAGVSGLAQQLAKAHPQPPGLLQPQTQLSVEQQQQPPPLAPGLAGQQPAGIAVSQVAANVPPSLPQPSMAQSAAQPVQNGSVLASLSQAPVMPTGVGLPIGQGALPPATSQYPNLPPLTAAQLEDARRFLLQEQSLLSLPKLAAGECASEAGTSLAHDPSGGINALAASATLLPLKTLPLATHVVDGEDDSSSGASVVAIDNKIEQAMDLVKSHLMYAVREEVEVLKEQIKELIERNSQLEQENNLLKNLASPEQLAQFQAQLQSGSPPASSQPPGTAAQQAGAPAQPASQSAGPSA